MTITASGVLTGSGVYGRDGRIGTVAGTRERPNHPGYLLVQVSRLLGLWRRTHVVPVAWISVSERGARTTLAATRAQVAGCPRLRGDAEIQTDVMLKLAAASRVHWTAEVHVTVSGGVVRLGGQPADSRAMKWASKAADGVMGVVAVETP